MINPQDFKMKLFIINASSANKIMGRVGLTEIQLAKMAELTERDNNPMAKSLTANMRIELNGLLKEHKNPQLPKTCKTFLHEWYANDNEDIYSKYTAKGEMVEDDLIDFAIAQLGYGIGEKNRVRISDEYFTGECDVDLSECVIDVKAAWNKTTLHQRVIEKIDEDYKLQLEIYCHLYGKPKGILFHGLMDTPPDANNGNEVIYSDLPDKERWFAFTIPANPTRIDQVRERVLMCREYLVRYDNLIRSMLGNII